MSNGSQLHCPYCGGRQLQVATDTQFSTSTNVTRKKVITTVSSQHIRYWCCANCGSTFPFPQDVQQQAEALAREAEANKKFGIFCAIAGVCCLPLMALSGLGGLFVTITIIDLLGGAALIFSVAPSKLEESKRRYAEYEDLLHKCLD